MLRLAPLLLLLAALTAAPSATAEPAACVPTNGGGLDYHSQLCVDPSDRDCPAYHEGHSDAGIERTCVP